MAGRIYAAGTLVIVATHGADVSILPAVIPSSAGTPQVAVVMPSFNQAPYIAEAIESVLAQNFAQWELVVVDDGSTDDTVDVVRQYRDPRILLIERSHQGLSGIGAAYRAAVGETTAPLIAILEGDDRWPADKLGRQVVDFEDDAVVLSYGAGELIDDLGCTYGTVEPSIPGEARTNRPTGSIVPHLLAGNPILSPTVVVRRSALDAIGGFWQPDDVPYVDHPTWLLLALEGAFAYNPQVVGSWRRHAGQWTTRTVDGSESAPEASYVGRVADRYREFTSGTRAPLLDAETFRRRHADRALTNRWRRALLAADSASVRSVFSQLVRTGRPRHVATALAGLAMWAIGSDLEWVQLRRHRVAWPPRRHVRDHVRHRPSAPTPRTPHAG